MEKIMIIGCGGAGKSTLARQLGNKLHIPIYHLDAIFWQPNWTPIDRQTFITKQHRILSRTTWIIDGNYRSTMDDRLLEADTIIFLHYKTIRCLYGIVKRRIQYRKQTRPDMGEACAEKLDLEFFRWVAQFNKNKAPSIYEKLSRHQDKTIHIFHNPKQTKRFLDKLETPS